MVKKEYICDLCKVEMKSDQAQELMFGVHFGHRNEWSAKTAWECNAHICKVCVTNIKRMPDQIKTPPILMPA